VKKKTKKGSTVRGRENCTSREVVSAKPVSQCAPRGEKTYGKPTNPTTNGRITSVDPFEIIPLCLLGGGQARKRMAIQECVLVEGRWHSEMRVRDLFGKKNSGRRTLFGGGVKPNIY